MWEVKRKDGTYLQERVTDELTGYSRILSVKLKDASRAEKKRAREKLEQKIAGGRPRKDKLSDLFSLYLAEQEHTVKLTSVLSYRSLDRNILETVGDVYADHLTAGYIKKRLIDSGKSPVTCNRYIARIKACLKWSYQNDLIRDNAVYEKLALFPEPQKRERIQDKFLEPDELASLIKNTPDNVSLFIRFLSLTGMRIGEAIALDRSDVWGDEIHITKTFSTHTRTITPPKSFTSNREIHIQPELKECLKAIYEYMEFQQKVRGYVPTPYLFTNLYGGRYSYDVMEDKIREYGEAILHRHITSHIMRHTHASMLAAAGYPLEAISRRLGHEGTDITKAIYLHQTQKLKAREAEQLDKITLIPLAV